MSTKIPAEIADKYRGGILGKNPSINFWGITGGISQEILRRTLGNISAGIHRSKQRFCYNYIKISEWNTCELWKVKPMSEYVLNQEFQLKSKKI